MDVVEWNDDLSVGVGVFNDEHKHLISYINQLNQALKLSGTDKTMNKILVGLVNYTKIHFKHEEDYMTLYDYPDYMAHKKEHDELTGQVADFYERFSTGQVRFSLELMTFLRDWLVNHIQGCDMKYKEYFNVKGVR